MAEKLPAWAAWLFSTPWWVPAILAVALTAWMMWITFPRKSLAGAVTGDAGLIEAHAKLAHETRMADKAKRVLPERGATFFPPTVTQSDPPPFKAENVYVGQVFVEIDRAAIDNVVFFLFRCFNGSGNGINIKNPTGRIRVGQSKDGTGIDFGDMQSAPSYVEGVRTDNIKPGEEFELRLEQRISVELASNLALFPASTSFTFGFNGLEILLQSVRWHTTEKLRMWDGASILPNQPKGQPRGPTS